LLGLALPEAGKPRLLGGLGRHRFWPAPDRFDRRREQIALRVQPVVSAWPSAGVIEPEVIGAFANGFVKFGMDTLTM